MNELNKRGLGYLSFGLIILGIAAIVTILVLVFYEPKDEVIINSTPEALDFSRQKGCDVDGGQIWCGITQSCYFVKTEKCESTTITDQYGCRVNEGQIWCNEGAKCINKGEVCVPRPITVPPTTPPVTPPPVTTPPVTNLTPITPLDPNDTFNPNNTFNNSNVTFNPNMTGNNS